MPGPRKCVVCGSLLSTHERFAGVTCRHWRCRWAKLDGDLLAHRGAAAAALGVGDPESFPVVVVPFRVRRLVPLAAVRRQAFERFLTGVGGRALQSLATYQEAASNPTEEATGSVADLAGKVCTVCGGVCCHRGGEHAFQDEDSFRLFLATRPDLVDTTAVSAYLAWLPEEHYEDACVYQTAAGCALPREMRASRCNAYQCRGLRDAMRHFRGSGSPRLFVVVRHDNRIVRSAFVDVSAIRSYSPRAEGPS